MIVEPGKIYIRKVRALRRGGVGPRSQDTLALQRRLADSLSTAMTHPSGLPVAAILCVRKLHSPAPGSFSSRAVRSSYDWEQAVAVSLQQLVRRAARPAHGEVPVNAEAVLFADRAEMLASLANDWCKGNAGIHWWWKSLFREQEISQIIVSAWLDKPGYIPAALQQLTNMGQVGPFLRSLRTTDVQNMLSGVIYCFALYELQPIFESFIADGELRQATYQQESFHRFRVAPWQIWAPESADDTLKLEQQWLLAIGLTLMRAPAVARSSSFAHNVLQSWKAEDDPISATVPVPLSDEYDAPTLEAEIDTELGGLFYLINLGLFLDLYGDFITPLQPGIALSIWDFITLLGQELGGEERQTDPVWPFLARLAGRSVQDPPGQNFVPLDNWRMPVEWLRPFTEEGPWHWAEHNGRLQVWHPAQFLVLDVPLKVADPLEQLANELQAYSHVEAGRHKLEGSKPLQECLSSWARSEEPALGIVCWLRWFMPYVRARLQRALGLASADDIANILCRHHAHISLTATHLDLVLSLDRLPIEVRLSGLDRNPGWVPAAGRYITFYFE